EDGNPARANVKQALGRKLLQANRRKISATVIVAPKGKLGRPPNLQPKFRHSTEWRCWSGWNFCGGRCSSDIS
nr:hypothetical protein [Tanacetum cinerariifolium]